MHLIATAQSLWPVDIFSTKICTGPFYLSTPAGILLSSTRKFGWPENDEKGQTDKFHFLLDGLIDLGLDVKESINSPELAQFYPWKIFCSTRMAQRPSTMFSLRQLELIEGEPADPSL